MHIHCVHDVLIGQETIMLLHLHLQWQLVFQLYKKKAHCLDYAFSEIILFATAFGIIVPFASDQIQYFSQPSPTVV